GTEIPHGGETPLRQHFPHRSFEVRGRCTADVIPRALREMNVTVPEAGNDGFSAAIDDAGIVGQLDFAALADRGDHAAGRYDDDVGEWAGVRRRIYLAAHENEFLRARRGARKNRR